MLLYDEKQLPHRDEPATCRKMPAIQVGNQLPETPRSDEDCEDDPLTPETRPAHRFRHGRYHCCACGWLLPSEKSGNRTVRGIV